MPTPTATACTTRAPTCRSRRTSRSRQCARRCTSSWAIRRLAAANNDVAHRADGGGRPSTRGPRRVGERHRRGRPGWSARVRRSWWATARRPVTGIVRVSRPPTLAVTKSSSVIRDPINLSRRRPQGDPGRDHAVRRSWWRTRVRQRRRCRTSPTRSRHRRPSCSARVTSRARPTSRSRSAPIRHLLRRAGWCGRSCRRLLPHGQYADDPGSGDHVGCCGLAGRRALPHDDQVSDQATEGNDAS